MGFPWFHSPLGCNLLSDQSAFVRWTCSSTSKKDQAGGFHFGIADSVTVETRVDGV